MSINDTAIRILAELNRHIEAIKGGEGSGNFGHAGRPGEVGGSGPGGGGDGDGETSSYSDSESGASEKYSSSLSVDEKQALYTWGGSGNSIRKVQSGDTSGLSAAELNTAKHNLSAWESAVEKAPTHEGEIYRGLHDLPDAVIDGWNKGTSIELRNDQSATSSVKVVDDFGAIEGQSFANAQSVVWVMDQKSGKNLMGQTHVTMGGKSISEFEIVARKGTKYTVVKKEFWSKGKLWDAPAIDAWMEGSGYSSNNMPEDFRMDHHFQGHYVIYLKESGR
jgi:hypothetical protein